MIFRRKFCLILGLLLLSLSVVNAQQTMKQDQDTVSVADVVANYTARLDSIDSPVEIAALCNSYIQGQLTFQEQFEIYLETGIALYDLKSMDSASVYFNKSRDFISSSISEDKLGKYYTYNGWIASDHNQYNEAIKNFKLAAKCYAKVGKVKEQGNTYNSIGAMYWYLSNYAHALNYFNQTFECGKQSKDTQLLLKGLTNMGVVLNQLAQYDDALKCFDEALENSQLVDDPNSKANILNNLGNVHYALNQYSSALRCFNEALVIYSKIDDKSGISRCHNNLGEVYLKLGQVGKALQSYQTSLDYLDAQKDSSSVAIAYVNIGKAHQYSKAYLKAVSYFERALKIMVSHEDVSLEIEAYLHLAQVMMASRNFDKGDDYLNKAIELAKKIDEKVLLADCYNTMSDLFNQTNNYKQAYEFKTLYANLKDSILDEQALVNSARMEAVYNLLEKDEKISELEQENISKEEDLERVKDVGILYLVISASLLGLIIFLVLLFRLRRKSSLQLKEKNKELAQLNATKDKFFSIIAHDLKSPFSSLMGFAEMLCLHAESKNSNEVIEYSQVIHNSTKRLLGLVENLLQWSRTQLGTTEYSPSQIDVSIHAKNIVSLLRLNAEEKDIVISSKVENDLLAWADLNLFSTVLRNLISNAIKFSRIGSVICVSAQRVNGLIEVSVADTGVGIREENLEKLFQVDTAFTTKGTFNEKGTGIGLVLCKEFVEINKGTIAVSSELEKGSTFTFTLPICAN